jgi:hypothetical protein
MQQPECVQGFSYILYSCPVPCYWVSLCLELLRLSCVGIGRLMLGIGWKAKDFNCQDDVPMYVHYFALLCLPLHFLLVKKWGSMPLIIFCNTQKMQIISIKHTQQHCYVFPKRLHRQLAAPLLKINQSDRGFESM